MKQRENGNKQNHDRSRVSECPKSERSNGLPWMNYALFFVLSFVLLFIGGDGLCQFFWRSYFLYDVDFAAQTIGQPGGLAFYASLFLNQLFRLYEEPWLRWIPPFLLSIVLTVLPLWLRRCYGVVGKGEKAEENTKREEDLVVEVFSFVPSIAYLSYLFSVNYEIYAGFAKYLWTPLLGVFSFLAYFEIVGILKRKWQMAVVSLILLFLFPLLGMLALLPIVLFPSIKMKQKWGWSLRHAVVVKLLTMMAFVLVLPLFTWLVSSHYATFFDRSLFAPFPEPNWGVRFVPVVVMFGSLLLADFYTLRPFDSSKIGKKWGRWVVLSGVSLCATYPIACFSKEESRTYRLDMKLVRLTEKQEWREMIKTTKELTEISRIENAFRVIALSQTNQLAKQLFRIPLPFKPSPSESIHKPFYGIESSVCSAYLRLYASMFSVAEEMSMEDWVNKGPTNEKLKMFALLALLNEENGLAHRYVDIMKRAAGLSAVANQYEKYIGHKDEFYKENPSYKKLKEHQFTEVINLNAKEPLASYYIAYHQFRNDNMERRLLTDLYIRRLDWFLSDLQLMGATDYSGMPDCFKEAITLQAMSQNQLSLLGQFQIDGYTVHRVQSLVIEKEKNKDKKPSELARSFYPKYGGSYAYYCLFSNDIEEEMEKEDEKLE